MAKNNVGPAVELLKRERDIHLELAQDLQNSIDILLGNAPSRLSVESSQEPKEEKENLRSKLKRVLKEGRQFILAKDLGDKLNELYPNEGWDKDKVSKILTAIKERTTDHGLTIVQDGLKANSFHGYVQWLEAPNKPRPEHMYDKSKLIATYGPRKSRKNNQQPELIGND